LKSIKSTGEKNNMGDLFKEIVPLCKRTNEIINDVFMNNERIMEQFVKDLFLVRVQVKTGPV
jgi:hypothetical protein